jgi:LAO/AO transport system kinase
MQSKFDLKQLSIEILEGNRVSLGRAITLVESRLPEHRLLADELMEILSDHAHISRRIAITGVPGVGKSTAIEALGLSLIQHRNQSVAVLAIDPSSSISGGSILGDKTRMQELSKSKEAFIRPTPSGGHLGGVGERTMQTILLCEAAGFDNIIIETVGVGQSETEIRYMADIFILLMLPGAGDELQGIKRGIMEMTDLIVLNKFDGVAKESALDAMHHYRNALHYFPPRTDGWQPKVLKHSMYLPDSTLELLDSIDQYFEHMDQNQGLTKFRAEQNTWWFKEQVHRNWLEKLYASEGFEEKMHRYTQQIREGSANPFQAARTLLKDLDE